ncbi:MAG TPA: hypothetical protein PK874_13025 [Desulfobacteraceae bacterium]|nr:hypothetical protein [Desulfobacteraceae bacterium]HPJ67698.1 hypothetical protein [Desulfobacteraceae bacterium]HPQ29575.1 hypothetical protein [Desulfobacteraceae bacterium]
MNLNKSISPVINRNFCTGVGLCLVFFILLCTSSVSGDMANSAPMNIVGKGPSHIIVSAERHYRVTDQTLILDLRKKKIKLTDLPVPCEAVIEYRLVMDQDPICQKIEVRSTKVDAKARAASSEK